MPGCLVEAQYIEVPILAPQLEIAEVGAQPLIENFFDLDGPSVQPKPAGRLIAAMVGVAFNLHMHVTLLRRDLSVEMVFPDGLHEAGLRSLVADVLGKPHFLIDLKGFVSIIGDGVAMEIDYASARCRNKPVILVRD